MFDHAQLRGGRCLRDRSICVVPVRNNKPPIHSRPTCSLANYLASWLCCSRSNLNRVRKILTAPALLGAFGSWPVSTEGHIAANPLLLLMDPRCGRTWDETDPE